MSNSVTPLFAMSPYTHNILIETKQITYPAENPVKEEIAATMSALPVVHRAAYFGDVEEIRRLLAIGYGVNQDDNTGNTPMHYAAEYGNEGVITLLHYGAEVNHADNYGSTPHGYECIIARLHSLGADVFSG